MPERKRYAIVIHDPDDTMSKGQIIGPFRTRVAAEHKADVIRKMADDGAGSLSGCIEAVILPVYIGQKGSWTICEEVAA